MYRGILSLTSTVKNKLESRSFKNGFKNIFIISFIFLVTFILAQGNNEIKDEAITNAVESELWIDYVVDMNTINVETHDGIVTFTGTVDNILAKERAGKIAETIVGVQSILNRIQVKPHEKRTDEELRKAVKEALLRDPATESYEVRIKVDDGAITISGNVDSWQERELVSMVVKGVKGVRSVKNETNITFDKERPDIEIEREIRAAIQNDVLIDNHLIKVRVKNGEAYLSGTVNSLKEKNRAISDGWISGVTNVNANDLDIEWWMRDKMRRDEKSVTRTDEELKNAVKEVLKQDPRVVSFNPEVTVDDGTVTLKGVVTNLKSKKVAEQDAKNVLGVWRVRNLLKVQPVVMPEDQDLEENVEEALLNDPLVDRADVDVKASFGRVFLNGKVNTSFERYHAGRIAEKVSGVIAVINNLDYDYVWKWKSDREIKNNVKEQLKWSIFLDGSDIDVSVDDGIVTLEGEVYNWNEYSAAEKNAYQGGAKDVKNELDVAITYYGPSYQYPFWMFY